MISASLFIQASFFIHVFLRPYDSITNYGIGLEYVVRDSNCMRGARLAESVFSSMREYKDLSSI